MIDYDRAAVRRLMKGVDEAVTILDMEALPHAVRYARERLTVYGHGGAINAAEIIRTLEDAASRMSSMRLINITITLRSIAIFAASEWQDRFDPVPIGALARAVVGMAHPTLASATARAMGMPVPKDDYPMCGIVDVIRADVERP